MVAIDCALSSVCLQRVGRADVGLGRARAHRDAEADAGDVGRRPGREPGLGAASLEHLARVTARSNGSPPVASLISSGVVPNWNDELVAGGALELRAELSQRAGDAAACQDLELSGLHVDHRSHEDERQS